MEPHNDRTSKSMSIHPPPPPANKPEKKAETKLIRISLDEEKRLSEARANENRNQSLHHEKTLPAKETKPVFCTDRRTFAMGSTSLPFHWREDIKKESLHHSKSENSSRIGSRSSANMLITVPGYLNPQPKYFVNHLEDDLVLDRIDPMAESEEEEIVVESVESEYSDNFDYETLYDTKTEVEDDDDYIPPVVRDTESVSTTKLGGEEEEAETEVPAVEETLSDCENRSDDEIERDRAMKDLYDKSIVNALQQRKITKFQKVEPPSITQKTLDEYFLDREEEKIDFYKEEYADWFYTEGSEILHRRKLMACLDAILVKERVKYSKMKDEFKGRWEAGQERQMIIDQALVKFDGYYKETLAKRNRAVRQTTYEMGQRIQKIHEINRSKKELECLLRLQVECDKRLERFKIFERYLEKVRDESQGEFSDIKDVIDRYGVLAQARGGLIKRNIRNQNNIERAQNSLNRTVEIRKNEILVYNNFLSELRVYRDKLQEEIIQLEEVLLHIKVTAATRTLLIGQIKLAINNLYLGVCKQLGRAGRIPAEDTFRQLNYIKSSMKEIIKLSRDVKQLLRSAHHQAEMEAKERARIEREGKKSKYKHIKTRPKPTDIMGIFGFETHQA